MLVTAIGALIVNLIMGYFLHNVPGSIGHSHSHGHGHIHGQEHEHTHKHSLFNLPEENKSVYESDSHKDSSDEERLIKDDEKQNNSTHAIKETSVHDITIKQTEFHKDEIL